MKIRSENLTFEHKKNTNTVSLFIRLFQPEKDIEPLARLLYAPSPPSDRIRETIMKGYRRFPWGLFLVEDTEGGLAGTVQVGFYRPRLLILALGRLPARFPTWLCKALYLSGLIREFELSNIHIDENWRGSGLAEALLSFAEEFGKRRWKADSITLLVREENIPAVKLYEKAGYKRTGIFSSGNIEKLIMVKQLRI